MRNKALLAAALILSYGSVYAIEIVNRPYEGSRESSPGSVQVTPVASPVHPSSSWTMDVKDVNYFGAFQRWAKDAGYQVRWDAEKHFVIEAVNTFSGTFEDAVTAVLDNPAVKFSKYPLEVCFYPNVPPLARITRKGAQEKECR
ncbi:TcpQ domain-containing protein [Comamonas sp. w2-DMI]|uniref:TcpQ domain-containing protein n=1 Tax=Comamonas sp. w2-DMI TaxID=3126391 RepID=UPI0032E431C6